MDEEGRCALCRNGLRGFEGAYCYGVYGGVLRRLIHLFKYQKVRSLKKPLADYLLRALPRDERFDAIVPVPLHWRRRWRRGFNQCELLAREVSRRTGIPVAKALHRPLASKAQAGLTLAARRHNVKTRSFSASAKVAGQSILLLDDVMTTGSTATACALALKRAGAVRVSVLTVARADRLWQAAPKSRVATGEGSAGYDQ
ncbi:MAG: ComF family protein [Bryobacteraceae bacterium]